MAETLPLLAAEGLAKRFGGIVAVNGCSFQVRPGTVTGLIGPNGSGKTTTFDLITGFQAADGGRATFRGRDILGMPAFRIARLGLSRTFQLTRLFREMTVFENLLAHVPDAGLLGVLRGTVRRGDRHRAEELLEFVNLTRLREAPARSLSYGQQKLLEFAAALMPDPELILLDEPMGGVNPVMIEHLIGHIRALHRQGKTFLIVEHNMPVVMELCDPVIVLHRGQKIAEGPPEIVQQSPAVLDAYMGA